MELKIVFSKSKNTVDIWFDNPKKEVICEEIGNEIIFKKDKNNRVIGLEKLNYITAKKDMETRGQHVMHNEDLKT